MRGYLYRDCKPVRNYAECEEFFSSARSAEKGKPITRWLRMYKEGYSYTFYCTNYGSELMGHLSPDNVFTFDMSMNTLMRNANTLSGATHRNIPFVLFRVAKGRYRVEHALTVDASDEYFWQHMRKGEAPEYFEGIQFDMITGKCLNPRPDLLNTVDESARTEWLRALKQFKRGIKLRAKMNVFDSYLANRVHEHKFPNWGDKKWVSALTNAIRNQDFNETIMRGIADTTPYGDYWRRHKPLTGKDVVETVDALLKDKSLELRKEFGVFKQEM